ncbi:hypothetical protein HZY91_03710 [Facklamia sp. DSM 111018]|uniref:DUF2127 domain-containing protein n=1 Tax=Facklamia lactis TaxID=2749967 RepID=A0ABS0LPA7_9LACT|nr:hypothetical protein [Facklamia lactis]MBG9980195.1 hypothetical protein [Facklamia lactis]MBG9985998.1 hypothetical protein [Facklamia lactis]
MKKIRVAAILMLLHGLVMELGTGIFFILTILTGFVNVNEIEMEIFYLEYFQKNLEWMLMMSLIFGVVRSVGALGLLKRRKWGFILSIINCLVTMVLMVFMLPSGIMDGLFACSSLILILMAYYGENEIEV